MKREAGCSIAGEKKLVSSPAPEVCSLRLAPSVTCTRRHQQLAVWHHSFPGFCGCYKRSVACTCTVVQQAATTGGSQLTVPWPCTRLSAIAVLYVTMNDHRRQLQSCSKLMVCAMECNLSYSVERCFH